MSQSNISKLQKKFIKTLKSYVKETLPNYAKNIEFCIQENELMQISFLKREFPNCNEIFFKLLNEKTDFSYLHSIQNETENEYFGIKMFREQDSFAFIAEFMEHLYNIF